MFPPQTTHASCTSIRGFDNRQLLPQWIEHHRLIGVEHFFVYVNEPFNQMDEFYNQPYITYIPFDYHESPKDREFYFQAIWQNDCIYRARNASVSWVGIHDIDEYWNIRQKPYTLKSITNTFDPNEVAGIAIQNMWFGPHPEESFTHYMHQKPSNLLMDYVWRSPMINGPNKFIVSPKLVDYHFVHWMTKYRGRIEHKVIDKIIMNHYRRPYDHVHTVSSEDAVRDSGFRNEYKDGVMKALLEKNAPMTWA